MTQGLTEFLPVSSSAHLILLEELLGINPPGITLEVALHFGTALAVLLVFRKRITQVILSLFQARLWKTSTDFRFLLLLIVGSVPAGVVGFFSRSLFKEIFDSPQASLWASTALLVTGFVLHFTKYASHSQKKMGFWNVLTIGISQAASILPGLSRSGLTIATGLLFGLNRDEVVEFSFLLALPAIFGAVWVERVEFYSSLKEGDWTFLLIGTFFAFTSGLLAIKLLLTIVRKGRLNRFAYYCWGVGTLGILLSI